MKAGSSARRWVRDSVQQQVSYHVPDAGDYIKIDAMENPWPMPADVDRAWRDALAGLELNRYPAPRADELAVQLRRVMDIPQQAEVLLGNGSDELIQLIMMALTGSGRVVLAPSPSFVMYEVLAQACGMDFVGVPLNGEFQLDMQAMREAIQTHQPAVIFLASPNNPTGAAFRSSEIEEIIELASGLVVVDEAYQPFTSGQGSGFMHKLADYPDLVVMRTLSKVGLAGIRLGLIAGNQEWLNEFDKLRLPYNINTLTQATASFALQHWQVFQQQINAICEERERVRAALEAIETVEPRPSDTNFILFRVSGMPAVDVHKQLLERGILIKCLHRDGSPLENCLRVTIGMPDENTAFLEQLTQILG
jgi:histidinol-phosphate aminotransferase